ncbi:MAG: hypothetical protein RLZZ227_265 [Pseudomonadota bacterium]|jgi:tRNA pseudouridine13 synthase
MITPLPQWKALERAFGEPALRVAFKQQLADFRVEEQLGFEGDGTGEHLLLFIEKTGLTTFDAQDILARHFRVPLRDTAFAGMKDKMGITRQWFSVPHGDRTDTSAPVDHPQLRVLHSMRNSRKLRRGSHRANDFHIVLRNPVGDLDSLLQRADLIGERGVPNYFGAQRFGRNENNVPDALAWFRGEATPLRQQRSLLLSATRSYLFNVLLSQRVKQGSWNAWVAGDVMQLAGSASSFACSRATPEDLQRRLAEFDIHATGPLWGQGEPAVTEDALALERDLADQYPELCAGLVMHGLEQERRPLRAQVKNLQVRIDGDEVIVEFSLARGTYATSVLRELVYLEGE